MKRKVSSFLGSHFFYKIIQSSKELRKVSKIREISPVQFCIHTAVSEVLNQLLARQNSDDGMGLATGVKWKKVGGRVRLQQRTP